MITENIPTTKQNFMHILRTLYKLCTYSTQYIQSQTAKTLGSMSIGHQSDAKVSVQCVIDIDPNVFAIWGCTPHDTCHGNIRFTDPCAQPRKVGPCRAAFRRYFFNKRTGRCERFSWGGCQPNENNFETLEQCQSKCYGKIQIRCLKRISLKHWFW